VTDLYLFDARNAATVTARTDWATCACRC